jgi:FtsP/CotA-like multicopper oxidase with cupredoxin domain
MRRKPFLVGMIILVGCESASDQVAKPPDAAIVVVTGAHADLTAAGALRPDALLGGTLDPTAIPKYVTPLVIPPVMNNNGTPDNYSIAIRQFKQQILPGGIWNTINGRNDAYPATTVWSYGPKADPVPDSSGLGGAPGIAPASNSQFNYPGYTIETLANVPVRVRWSNDLVDEAGNYLPHLLPVDQTLQWANPPMDCHMGSARTDCKGDNPEPYTGPVPIVAHVHGAHVDPHSDGYPAAWWLPAANDIPAGYARSGAFFDDATGSNDGTLGYADFFYRQDQPATTLWYHDHAMGLTRLNVYAGAAGFWLLRDGKHDRTQGPAPILSPVARPALIGGLPGPAPVAGQTVLDLNTPESSVRSTIREIPIVIQDRAFNADGSLSYPDNRAFFEGLNVEGTAGTSREQFSGSPELRINFAPESDIAPIWNPEAFFNVMVVNGVSWPKLEVAPARYRFRLLDGCNSRFLNLALFTGGGLEIPFFQIGAEQGFLQRVVMISTGFATPLPGNGMVPARVASAHPQMALLMGPAERADVIVDFSGLANGTVITMVNTAPDAPFGGFPDVPADPATTGQVMQFVVNTNLLLPGDARTASPFGLKLKAEKPLKKTNRVRQVSLDERDSEEVCVIQDADGNVIQVGGTPAQGCPEGGVPFGPKDNLLGVVDLTDPLSPRGIPLKWADTTGISTPVPVTLQRGAVVNVNVTENPRLGDTEEWQIYNFTADAHPIHLHLVRFQVVRRQAMNGGPSIVGNAPQPWESGFKDTVIAYPGEITRVKALFDIPGLYVWHCHIIEHEDHEMMRPYVVSPQTVPVRHPGP